MSSVIVQIIGLPGESCTTDVILWKASPEREPSFTPFEMNIPLPTVKSLKLQISKGPQYSSWLIQGQLRKKLIVNTSPQDFLSFETSEL